MCLCKSGICTSRPACIFEASQDQVQLSNPTKHIMITQNQNDTDIQAWFLQSCSYTVLLTRSDGVGWLHSHLSAVWMLTSTKLSSSTRNNSTLLRLIIPLIAYMIKASLEWKEIKKGEITQMQVQILTWARLTRRADFSENPSSPQRNNQHTPRRGSLCLSPWSWSHAGAINSF